MNPFNDKVVLLTGGSRGIGPLVAEALARRGAALAIAARSKSGLEEVSARLKGIGVETLVVPADLREQSHREELVFTVLKQFNRD